MLFKIIINTILAAELHISKLAQYQNLQQQQQQQYQQETYYNEGNDDEYYYSPEQFPN